MPSKATRQSIFVLWLFCGCGLPPASIAEQPSPFQGILEKFEEESVPDGTSYEKDPAFFYPTGICNDPGVLRVFSQRHLLEAVFRNKGETWHLMVQHKRTQRDKLFPCGIPSAQVAKLSSQVKGSYLAKTDGNYLAVAAWLSPQLVLFDTITGALLAEIQLKAPVRDMAFDLKRGLLWTIGPENNLVRRQRGKMENLHTAIYGYRLPELSLQKILLWYKKELVDGNALAIVGDELFATAGGSGYLWRYHLGSSKEDLLATGPVPRGLAAQGKTLSWVNYLSDEIEILDIGTGKKQRLALSKTPRQPDFGELLFYQTGMWADTADNAFTCNSCHWDGLSDHRLHPGFLEKRWELTRPVAGIAAVKPIFTPMQAANLSEAIEGFFRVLDVRYWQKNSDPPYYLEPVRLRVSPEETIEVSALEARKALLKTLIGWPALAPARRRVGEALSKEAKEGAAIFLRDCARCHEPVTSMRTRRKVPLAVLRDRPLVFAAPFYAQTGIKPYFTAQGNRISPLLNLARGGPFFSNGSAPDLESVVLSANPSRSEVHAPENARNPFYSADEREKLLAFLRSI